MNASTFPAALSALPPWSKSQLRQLGKCLRDGTAPSARLPSYEDVLLWYDELAVTVQGVIRGIDWSSVLGSEASFEVTSRAKTLDTLREKLSRRGDTPLSNVQDIAGVRFEAEMALSEQDAAVAVIAGALGIMDPSAIHDLRNDPHSGYRAVHIWARLPAGHVEIQVRTHLQGRWANAYEALADIAGRGIRYGEYPSELPMRTAVESLQALSLGPGVRLEEMRQAVLDAEASLDPADPAIYALRGRDAGVAIPPGIEELFPGFGEMSVAEMKETVFAYAARAEAEYSESLESIESTCRDLVRRKEGA